MLAFFEKTTLSLVAAGALWASVDAASLIRLAEIHAAAGKDAQAAESLSQFVERLRLEPEAKSQISRASAVAEQIFLRNPQDFLAVYSYAELLFLSGKYQDALATLTKVRTEDRANADYYNLAGMAYAAMDDLPTASRAVIKAIELAPDRPDLLMNLAGLYQRALDHKSALMTLNKAVKMPSAPPEAFFALGVTQFNLGNFQEAVNTCEKAIRRRPDFAEAHLLMGRAYVSLNQFPAARRTLQRAVELQPDCERCYLELALVSPAVDSERLLRKVLAGNARQAEAHFRLGQLLADQKRTGEAIAELEQAVELDVSDDRAYYRLATLYRARGDEQKAAEIFAMLKERKETRRQKSEANLSGKPVPNR